jgi:predicted dehydrogenase|tara:strand:- start:766 stop:1917 length:1152 start_codon:yes stop_codon:yes gene_type:complete
MENVGIGVIGCGAMGLSLVQMVVENDPRLKVIALYDPEQRSVDRALSELASSPKVCSDYTQLMDMSNVQWVMIASWNCYHHEQIVSAFKTGKHVFCQKPLALSVDECVSINRAWQQSGTTFSIGYTLRYSPHYQKMKELISNGHIGKIISMEFNETLDFNHGGYIMGDWRRLRENAGGHILEKCCHDIDLANWMVNSVARRVASFGGLNFFLPENAFHIDRIGPRNDGKAAYSTWDGLVDLNPFLSEKDIIDNQVVILEYENGVRATFHTNCNAAIPERRMYILGTEGAIRANLLTGDIHLQRIGFDTEIENKSLGIQDGHGNGDKFLAKELSDTMLHNKIPSVGLMEGLISTLTCIAIDAAMDTGTVVDMRTYWNKIELDKS